MRDLWPSQRRALRATLLTDAPIIAWAGAVRSGKTDGLLECLMACLQDSPPHADFYIIGRTMGAVKRNILGKAQSIAARQGWPYRQHRGSNPVLEVSGRPIHLFGAPTEAAEDAIAGMDAYGGLIDEAARIPESVFWMAWDRLSHPNARLFCSLNKTSPYGWFKQRVWDRIDEWGGVRIESLIAENTLLDAATLERYQSTHHGHYHRRLILNEWAAASGQVYSDYQTLPAAPALSEECYLAMDWGPAGVTAGVFLAPALNGGGWVIFDEYRHDGRESGRVQDDHHVRAITAKGYKIRQVIVDPSAVPLFDAFVRGGYQTTAGDNKLERGVIITDNALRTRRLRVVQSCKGLLTEMDAYVWNPLEDKPVKGNDHSVDAMRYAAAQLIPIRSMAPRATGGL